MRHAWLTLVGLQLKRSLGINEVGQAVMTSGRTLQLNQHLPGYAAASFGHVHELWASPVRSMACSAGLGRPPPKTISIEYDPKDVDAFVAIADAIEDAFPMLVVEGNDGRPGSFEITADDVDIYSKLQSHRYPDPEHVVNDILAKVQLPSESDDKRMCT